MKTIRKINDSLYLNLTLFSIITAFILVTSGSEINRDGSGYLAQAQLILMGESSRAVMIYPDLFFAHLISNVSNLFHVSVMHGAKILNFFTVSAVFIFFQLILKKIFSTRPYINIAGLVVFLSSVSLMDNYLSMVLRDHGAWLGMIGGLYFLLLWISEKKIHFLVAFVCFILMSSFFRAEYLILIFMPLINYRSFQFLYIKKYFLFTFLLLILFLTLIFINFNEDVYFVNRLPEILTRGLFIIRSVPLYTDDLWLNYLLEDYPAFFKFIPLIFIFCLKLFVTVGIPYLLLLFLAAKNIEYSIEIKLIFLFILTLLALPLMNLFSVYVVTSRYLMGAYILLLLFVAFGLSVFISSTHQSNFFKRYKNILSIAFSVFFGISFLDTLIDNKSKSEDALIAEWISENRLENDNIYLLNMRARYYAGLYPVEKKSLNEAVEQGVEIIVIDGENFSEFNDYDEVKFSSKIKKSKIKVYKRK